MYGRTRAASTTGRPRRCLAAAVALAALGWAAPALAQGTGDGFLFKPPSGALSIRAGLDSARAGSDVFAFVTDQLTVTRADFRAMTLAGDVAVQITPRLGLLIGAAFARSATPSEFRDWLDNNDLPIQQTTTLERTPITASLKVYPFQPGQRVGHLAWIPSHYAPYVGVGGGTLFYRFFQTGDFIDFNTLNVFPDTYTSSGWRPTAHAFAGLDVSLSPRILFTAEVRYAWASAPLSSDFSGFGPIDLDGVAATMGISIRY